MCDDSWSLCIKIYLLSYFVYFTANESQTFSQILGKKCMWLEYVWWLSTSSETNRSCSISPCSQRQVKSLQPLNFPKRDALICLWHVLVHLRPDNACYEFLSAGLLKTVEWKAVVKCSLIFCCGYDSDTTPHT